MRSSNSRTAAPAATSPQSGGQRVVVGRGLRYGLCACLFVLTLTAFQGLGSHPFISYDDTVYVTENSHVQAGLTARSVAWAFAATTAAHWHPLTWLAHMLDVELFGLRAERHHQVSLLIHAANVLLIFLILERMTAAPWRSLAVAALFAVHPLHVESVAWIAERKDVLSTLFGFLTLAAWLGFVRSRRTGPYVLACALFALALLSKPMLVTLPFTLLLFDLWPLGRLRLAGKPIDRTVHGAGPGAGQGGESGSPLSAAAPRPLRALLFEKAPLLGLAAASCVATVVSSRAGGTVGTIETYTPAERVSNALVAYATYLERTLWPAGLAVFYPHPHGAILPLRAAACAALIAAVAALAVAAVRRAPWVTVGVLWYLGTLVPVIGLVQVGGQAMADRYTYVPLIGIFVAVLWSLAGLVERAPLLRVPISGAVAAAVLALTLATRVQLAYWRSDEALYEHALAVTAGNWVAHNNLGLTLFEQGRKDEAIAHYREALRYFPAYPHALANLGFALAERGDLAGAIDAYDNALRLDPDDPRKHFQLGLALARTGRADAAIAAYERTLALDPAFAEAHGNLANLLGDKGRVDEALVHYEASLRIRPGNPIVLYNLGRTLLESGRTAEAIARLSESVRLRPDLAEARNSLGGALLRAGRRAEAIKEIEAALRLKPGYASALRNLRAAQAGSGPAPGDPP